MGTFRYLVDEDIRKLSREKKHQLLLTLEEQVDEMLRTGIMSQETAWDSYFALLHDCNTMGWPEDHARIVMKIDTRRYNPFYSKNPEIVFLARLRAHATKSNSN